MAYPFDKGRIEALRAQALQPTVCYDEFYLHFFDAYRDGGSDKYAAYAQAYACAFDHMTPQIDTGELIVGKATTPLTPAQAEAWANLRRDYADPMDVCFGQDSHMTIDYDLLLREGTQGVKNMVSARLARETDPQKQSYLRLCMACLDAVAAFADRYADAAEALAQTCADEKAKAELSDIARICRQVPRHPARSFHEAVQSVHFMSFALSMDPCRYFAHQQFQLGRPDRYLYTFYRADVDAGILTDEFAQTLMDCLAIQINNRVPHGLSSGYMLGGRDSQGRMVVNELTHMGLQAIDDVRLVYPSVGLCYTDGMPDDVIMYAMEILSHGRSHPAIFNDDIISAGLMDYGVSPAECHDYIHSTCVEITPIASSNVWVASPYHNMLQMLLPLLSRDWPNFDALYRAVLHNVDAAILQGFEEQNRWRALRAERTIEPLLSCFVQDCIENATDINAGGARYNWIMPSFVGMANLVDSLQAMRVMVFEKGAVSFDELRTALAADYVGHEDLRHALLDGVDKYGNDVDQVDALFNDIVTHIVAECRKYTPMFPNAHLVPSVFCWIMHERFGRDTGASPDGRQAGFPLGDGSGPCQGREKNGPTASVLSSTKWSHRELIGGVAVNMKFSKKTFTADSCRKIAAITRTYMRRGGFELQINVVDRGTLLQAQQHPENYRDLVVRIGGYSDYFVKLSPQMQQEVLLRTTHEV